MLFFINFGAAEKFRFLSKQPDRILNLSELRVININGDLKNPKR